MVGKLRRKLGDDSEYPAYIFTEARVGYRMPRGRGRNLAPLPELDALTLKGYRENCNVITWSQHGAIRTGA